MNVRHLRFFVALSTERHFGRAAAACHVSQPALSMAIRRLEAELGVRLVERGGGSTVGLTEAGEALVDRARATVRGVDDIEAEASRLRGRLTATLRLGTVPTAVAAAPALVAPLLRAHPGVRTEIRTSSGRDLLGRVARHELDAALVYEDDGLAGVRSTALYRERFVLVGGRDDDPPGPVSWGTVGGLPLCLLTPEMQQRTILDDVFRRAGATVRPVAEADALPALLGFVREGWATVLGRTWLSGQRLPADVRVRSIVDPVIEPTITLVTAAAGPATPVVRALLDAVSGLDVEELLGAAGVHDEGRTGPAAASASPGSPSPA
ncbi:LysR family transcriptional regulator [Patulibacter minatonensis]|uniref:LysR family transcriptional regulator n=1 Tax=Patulibacter minatonensis TaxID=298163 RepID=UPI0004BAD4F0|nr:LysR family transcriptional regulator [Patulibacter minatonensis]